MDRSHPPSPEESHSSKQVPFSQRKQGHLFERSAQRFVFIRVWVGGARQNSESRKNPKPENCL